MPETSFVLPAPILVRAPQNQTDVGSVNAVAQAFFAIMGFMLAQFHSGWLGGLEDGASFPPRRQAL